MADVIISPNMSLPIPVVGVDPGPQWGDDVNSCLTLLDSHNHSPGYGVPITPGGMNINSDLTFQNNNLTNAKTLGMYAQVSDPSTLGCLYYKGVDLYFNDGSSNHIRITQSGSVSGASGTITGLPFGTASASYVSGSSTFVFQSATNTAANMDIRSLLLRNATVSSFSVTLNPPAAMGSDTALTLPTIPAQTNVMTLTSGGLMGSITYDAVGQAMTATGANAIAATRTRATGTTVGLGGVAITPELNFSTSSTTAVDVTSSSVTITTSGRPVMIQCINNDTTGVSPGILQSSRSSSQNYAYAQLLRDSSIVGVTRAGMAVGGATSINLSAPVSSLAWIDPVAAGTYTYKLQLFTAFSGSGTLAELVTTKMVVYEL